MFDLQNAIFERNFISYLMIKNKLWLLKKNPHGIHYLDIDVKNNRGKFRANRFSNFLNIICTDLKNVISRKQRLKFKVQVEGR